jgi:4-hydroxybenzoate polyprenyltransferase
MMARPPVVAVLLAFSAVGLAAAGHPDDLLRWAAVAVAVVAYFVNATCLNDLSDVEVDRVNLQGARGRPLVAGAASRRTLAGLAVGSMAVALVVGALLDGRALLVLGAGAAFNAAYSLRPVRLSARGVLAPILLPVGFVAVPFLVAFSSTGASPTGRDWWLLAALWVGFTGRIVLKDFRDVIGDGLYGKRTFLVRHGAWATCAFSATCWLASIATLVALVGLDPTAVALVAFLGCALLALRLLGHEQGFIAQQVEIGAVAAAGRGVVTVVLAHLVLSAEGWEGAPRVAVLAAVSLVMLGQFHWVLVRRGTDVVMAPY